MGFYYISFPSILLLAVVYAALILVFWGVARVTRNLRGRKALLAVVGAVFLVLPIGEELWIAWNFGQLCRKDAGIFVYKVVEVEGFYDATRPARPGPPTEGAQKSMDESGYRFHERPLRNKHGGPDKVVRFERGDGKWTPTVLVKPTAKYQYKMLQSHAPIEYKIRAFEWIIEDVEQQSIIAREKAYAREGYWFYIGLDRPTIFCPMFGNYGEKLTGGLYRLVLKPLK